MNEHCEILIVDDEPIVGDRLKSFLTRDGHQVESYTDPTAALARLDDKHFDILISDIRMGDIDGIQIMEQVLEKRLPIKVIMITGYATMELARESMTKGAFDFIAKPFKLKEIRHTIQQATASLSADSQPSAAPAVSA